LLALLTGTNDADHCTRNLRVEEPGKEKSVGHSTKDLSKENEGKDCVDQALKGLKNEGKIA